MPCNSLSGKNINCLVWFNIYHLQIYYVFLLKSQMLKHPRVHVIHVKYEGFWLDTLFLLWEVALLLQII